jgi:hypothetical protein
MLLMTTFMGPKVAHPFVRTEIRKWEACAKERKWAKSYFQ